nr:glycosyltransferase family 4 protein [uncultured Sphaerochaeta sp.]
MKILHINSYYAANGFYENLYNQQIKLGYTIKVFLPILKNEKLKFDYGEYVDIFRGYRTLDRLFFIPKHLKILKESKKRYSADSFDLIHAHSLISNGFVAHGLSKKIGIPYIVAVRDTDLNFFLKKFRFLKPLAKRILADASRIIFLSPGYREETIKLLFSKKEESSIKQKSELIPNGIDDFWLNNLSDNHRANLNKKNIQIITVGQICRRKNFNTACQAVEMLHQEGYNISHKIIGKVIDDGILSEILTYPFVQYINHLSKDKLIEYYRDSHVFVLPSITETFGLVYGESLSQGLPVIYTKGQGFDGQFEEGHVGYHVYPKDPADIAEKIKLVLNNYEHLSSNCVSSVEKFDWRRIAEQYKAVYEGI